VEGSASAFRECYLSWGRECFTEANIDNWSKLLLHTCMAYGPREAFVVTACSLLVSTVKVK